MSNMNELMRQAARVQRRIQQIHEEMKAKEWTAKVAGDKVSVTVSGERKGSAIVVDPEFYKTEDCEMVLDSIAAAVNAAQELAEKEIEGAVSQATGGLKIPGLTG
ncbi:MAG: YbaB/EbfC family nucleoid-associated protein [Polyangiales bacterium]